MKPKKNLYTAEELLQKDELIKNIRNQRNQLISIAPVIYVVISSEQIVVDCNKYATDLLGIKNGDDILEYYPDIKSKNFPKKLNENNGLLENQILNMPLKNGKYNHFHANISLVDYENKKATVVWGIDIESFLKQKEMLTRAQKDLQKILDSFPLAINIQEPVYPYRTIYVNEAFVKLFDFKNTEEAVSYSLLEMSPKFQANGLPSVDLIAQYINQIFSENNESKKIETEWDFILNNNKTLETKIISNELIYFNNKAIGLIIQDITAEKKHAQMLKNTAEQERYANQIKSKFVINMSHEIRTPMNAIIGLSEVALMRKHEKEVLDIFKKINTSSKNLLSIINDVLDFSKIEAEKLELIEEDFILEDVLSNALMVGMKRLEDKPVEMFLNVDLEIPKSVFGDKTRLWQILKNLLDNSAKFTKEGHILLSVAQEDLKFQDKSLITFVVEDTGIGMDKSHLEKLFTPFEQFHQDSSNSLTGTGLGMSITKQLTELMGGKIFIESQPNKGTKTTITIPFKKSASNCSIKNNIAKKNLKDFRALIIDKSANSSLITKNILYIMDCSFVCCTYSVEDAINTINEYEQLKKPFDFIILDYGLNKSILEYAEKLRQSLMLINSSSKIILLSNLVDNLMFEKGFLDIIEKPYCPTFFAQKLHDILKPEDTNALVNNISDLSGSSILLCEDNFINQEVAISMLSMFNVKTTVANNGKEALELLETDKFDLVFMDLIMPEMNGHETTKYIRASDKPYKDIPIIAMTANVVKEEIEACINEGMQDHIGKPIDFATLEIHLKKWL